MPAMIRHTVAFRLKHAPGSEAERDFLRAACELVKIEGVQKFEYLRQTSPKNPFAFGLSMEFTDAAAYAFYNDHPDHTAFVQQRWIPEVAEFMEIDYERISF
jgi:hypothetical protein